MDDTTSCPLMGLDTDSSIARQHLRIVGADWGADLLESALLATSELINNAVLHGGDEVRLLVRTSAEFIRVEVYDSGRMAGDQLVPDGNASSDVGNDRGRSGDAGVKLSGRGLRIVASLSERWGVTQHSRGKSVWFEMPRPHDPLNRNRVPKA